MEEEIITPEEETFNYNKLRYILDKDGYVCHASLGGLVVCDLGECTEYNGEVPSDYETIEEWYDGELDKLNAWKIVKGNLVFDKNKYNELQAKYEMEAEENATATHKYVNDKVNGISVSNSKDIRGLFDKATTKDFKVIKLDDTSDFTTDKITIDTTTKENKIDLVISNSNMLVNEFISTSKDGIKFDVSMDKQIKISGTSDAGKNLINPNKIIKGYGLTNGETYSANNRSIIDYLELEKNKTYTISGLYMKQIAYYDDNKNVISYTSPESTECTFEMENDTKYIRVSFDNTKDYESMQLEKGSTLTEYEPYIVEREYDLTKDSTNTIPFLLFKKNFDYCLSGLNGINLKMYYYDGTNRTEIYSGTDGLIKFTDNDKPVTHITLSIPVNTKINQTIAPMINLGTTALKYEKGEIVYKLIDFPDYPKVVVSKSLIAGDNTFVSYHGKIQVILDNGILKVIDEYEKEIEEIEMPSTFYPVSTIYTMQDTIMSIDYISSQSNGVPYDEVIKAINDSPETIKISADKLDIDAVATFTNSKLAKAGSTTINGSNITTGTIDASKVTVKNLNASNITSGTISANTISGGTISGSSINLGSGKFSVNTSGAVSCSNITATGGAIGGFTLDSEKLYSGGIGICSNGSKYAFWSGESNGAYGAGNTDAKFKVGHDGILQTTGAIISGTITGSTINGSAINGGSINITAGDYYFNMGTYTSNPNCSGLNVGYYGIKAYSDITATRFAITDGDIGKSGTFILRHQNGVNVVYLTFTGGILTAYDIV